MTRSKWNLPEQSRARTHQQTPSHGKWQPVGTYFPSPQSLQNQDPEVNVIRSTGWCQPLTHPTPLLNSGASLTSAPKPISQEKCSFKKPKDCIKSPVLCCSPSGKLGPSQAPSQHESNCSTHPGERDLRCACSSSLFSVEVWEPAQRGWGKKGLTPPASFNERPAGL